MPTWATNGITRNRKTGVVDLEPVNETRKPPHELISFDRAVDWLIQIDKRVANNTAKIVPVDAGLGFFAQPNSGLVVVELTKAFATDGKLKPFAETIRKGFPMAYAERSRCGRNLTLLVSSSTNFENSVFPVGGLESATIGFHSADFYVEFTGDSVGPVVDPVEDGNAPLNSLFESCRTTAEEKQPRGPKLPSVDTIKAAAIGRWQNVLVAAGMPVEAFNGESQPCPKCGGNDRFRIADDFDETGAVFCRQCFTKSTGITPGDGIATYQWWKGKPFGEVCMLLAEFFGVDSFSKDAPFGIIESVCRTKRMPFEAFKKFGAKPATRGKEKRPVARVPVYDESGCVSSHSDIAPCLKGYFKRGVPAGMFFPGCIPKQGEAWLLVEGVKDAAALADLGYNAAGFPSSTMPKKFANLFDGVNVVIVPDLDTAGQKGSTRTGGNLIGIANTVRVARLPGEMKLTGGDDVRDCLRQPNGEMAVRSAIDNAKIGTPIRSYVARTNGPKYS